MLDTSSAVMMGSMCAASVRCYAAALKAGTLLVDLDERHLPLRHSHHRYRIDGPNGVQTLTVPLVGSTNNMMTPLRDVLISEHGDWRRLHWGALYSAYGVRPTLTMSPMTCRVSSMATSATCTSSTARCMS